MVLPRIGLDLMGLMMVLLSMGIVVYKPNAEKGEC